MALSAEEFLEFEWIEASILICVVSNLEIVNCLIIVAVGIVDKCELVSVK